VGQNLPEVGVLSIFVNDSSVFAGMLRGGIWRARLSEVTAVRPRINSAMPKFFLLEQNYPNPFNPTTTIRYDIPKLSHVTLVIYDILGRQVEELVNGEKTPGSYQAVFNASNLPSDVYFYRLQAGTYHDTKKLLLLK